MIDPKLRRILEARGQWNSDGIARKARGRLCPKCGEPTMAGLDADLCAGVAVCNPQPLTPLGEVYALFAGLRTFTLEWLGGHYEINFRDEWRIKGMPAGSKKNVDVIAEHRCGLQFNGNQVAESQTIRTSKSEEYGSEPPF